VVDNPLRHYPGYALRRASVLAMARLAQRLAPMALRPAEASVLLVIAANRGVTQSEVGRVLDIASANMAPLASRLRKRQLILREQVDGRSQSLRLSPKGRALTRRVQRAIDEHEAELIAHVATSQRVMLLRLLRAISLDPTAER
jgi:DNA-binding MarR family transcriptional regulator